MEIINKNFDKKDSLLLQIEIERSILSMELEMKLQKYHLPGLDHYGFFKTQFEKIEKYNMITNQHPLELLGGK